MNKNNQLTISDSRWRIHTPLALGFLLCLPPATQASMEKRIPPAQLVKPYFPSQQQLKQLKTMPPLLLTPDQRLHSERIRARLIKTLYKFNPQHHTGNRRTYTITGFYHPQTQPERLVIFTYSGFLPVNRIYPRARIQLKSCTINACHLLINDQPQTLRIGQTLTLN